MCGTQTGRREQKSLVMEKKFPSEKLKVCSLIASISFSKTF